MLSNTSKNIILNTTHSPSSLKKKKMMMNRTLINNTKSSSVSAKNQKRNSRISVNGYNNNKAALLTLSVEDEVLKPVKETFENLKTVEGLKKISIRASKFAPCTAFALAAFGLFPTMGACMQALGVGQTGSFLQPIANVLLLSEIGNFIAAFAGICGIFGAFGDLPAYVHSLVVICAATALWPYSTVGANSTLVINALLFHYALFAQLILNCKVVAKKIPYQLMQSVKKIALIGPGLVMAFMQILPNAIEFGSFAKVGFSPPGFLGPIGALFLHPICPWIIIAASLLWLSDGEKKITSFVLGIGYVIPGISFCPTMLAPYSLALMSMHLVLGLQLLNEVTPFGSFIPNPL